MLVLHALWRPSSEPGSFDGSVFFWAESSEAAHPTQRVRPNARPQTRPHPFCAPREELEKLFGYAPEASAVLRLPTSRSGPLPDPQLAAAWVPDRETPPFLFPWSVEGLGMRVADGFSALLNLAGMLQDSTHVVLGADARFWQAAAGMVIEALATGKVAPSLVVGRRGEYFARWIAVMDGALDAPRMARLAASMPPSCRSEIASQNHMNDVPPAVHTVLDSFFNACCDIAFRFWGAAEAPLIPRHEDDPARRWLSALFRMDARVDASRAQLESLASSMRIWMRNLHVAGDRTFRIAFRLEAPQPVEGETPSSQGEWGLHYLLQARDDPSLMVPADLVWQSRGEALSQLGRRFERPQEKLLAGLGYASRLFPPITASLKSESPTGMMMDTPQAYTFLREVSPLLQDAGFGLLVPPWWNQRGARLGARLQLRPRGGKEVISSGKLSMDRLVDYNWQLSIGDTTLSREEFEALVQLKSPLVQIRGQWVQLDAEQVEAAIHFWDKKRLKGQVSLLEAVQMQNQAEGAGGLPMDGVEADDWLDDWLTQFSQASGDITGKALEQLSQPASFMGELRPYQQYGYSWLSFFDRWRLGAILADDMGLGKTIQALTLLLQQKEQDGSEHLPTLLIAPTSVVTNWEREAARFAPTLRVLVNQGVGRRKGEDLLAVVGSYDLVVTSYALLRMDIETLKEVNWRNVILDEAQNIKNPDARQTQAARKLQGSFRLALTGTPVENRLAELWSIMNFLNPGYLGSRETFRNDFSMPIERYRDNDATARLKKLVTPFILRRVKTDPRVIQDLPEKVESKVYVNLSEEQATLYEAVVNDVMEKISSSDGLARRGLILSMLMQLKQVCNHPAQYLHQSAKEAEITYDGRSGKLERLVELLEEILEVGDRALIFTQFAEMGELLESYLPQALGSSVFFLHGGTPAKQRDQMVRRFQEEEHAPPIFVLSLKAGGTGLNLTGANHVFHFDRWWNPAVEDQATDRAFRIGQHRNVQVHKFVTVGTLEESIDELIESKKDLANVVIGGGENWLTELNTDQLRDLVRLRRD